MIDQKGNVTYVPASSYTGSTSSGSSAKNALPGSPLYAPGATNSNFVGGAPFPAGTVGYVAPSNSGGSSSGSSSSSSSSGSSNSYAPITATAPTSTSAPAPVPTPAPTLVLKDIATAVSSNLALSRAIGSPLGTIAGAALMGAQLGAITAKNTSQVNSAGSDFADYLRTSMLRPGGLPKPPLWNEDPNSWFQLSDTVWAAGGSVSWNYRTSTATASIYGVNVDFKLGSDNVRINKYGRMEVRADLFYNTIMAKAKHLVFIGDHAASEIFGFSSSHASIIVFAYEGHDILGGKYGGYFDDTDDVSHSIYGEKIRFATMGAGPVNDKLIANFNRDFDEKLSIKTKMTHIEVSNDSLNTVFNRAQYYMEHTTDIPYPFKGIVIGSSGYNSNSFASGLLNISEIDVPYKTNVGWGNSVPDHNFKPSRGGGRVQ